MKRRLISTLAGGGLIVGLIISSAASAITWHMPTRSGVQNYFTQNIMHFAKDVKQCTNGKLNIEVHPASSLINQPAVKRAVRTGRVPIGEVLLSIYSNEHPIFGIAGIPFIAKNFKQNALLLKAAKPLIKKRLMAQGIRPLFIIPWPPSSFYSKDKITSVADVKGVKFRAYNPVTARMAKLMGAVPVTIQQAEVPQAFSTGIISAMITSSATGVHTHAWDFTNYFTRVKAMYPWNIVMVNENMFQSLDKHMRKCLLKAAEKAKKRGWEMARSVTAELVAKLEKHGIKIVQPTPKLMDQLTKIGETLVNHWIAQAGKAGKRVIERYRELKAEAQSKTTSGNDTKSSSDDMVSE